ncbi:DUF448 domain-containing protein [Sphingomicrobium sp. XHP0239]|uniref:DUF448 domain-containing protein n=1 Tax=Sphingomicrobium maritimum TaxID=3133972 RepID=UPI0031CC699D
MGTNDRLLDATDVEATALNEERGPERMCVLTRRRAPKDDLVRLALGPEGQVAPDIRARAPGRGAYVGATRTELDEAQASGKLKGALSRAFKTGKLIIPDDLAGMVDAQLKRHFLDRLGLEARSGQLISGAERVEVACRKGEVHLLLHAADAGEDGKSSLAQGWRMGGSEEIGHRQGLVLPFDRTTLAAALGRGNAVHLALVDGGAARRVRQSLARWHAFNGTDAGLNGGPSAAPAAVGDDDETKE